jgi:hypothetical protein
LEGKAGLEAGQGKDSKKAIDPAESMHGRFVAKEGGDTEIEFGFLSDDGSKRRRM